jgi:hypothetical protein
MIARTVADSAGPTGFSSLSTGSSSARQTETWLTPRALAVMATLYD